MSDISVLTHVMRHEHVALLDDWLGFINRTPDALIVVTGQDPAIANSLHALCRKYKISFVNIATSEPNKLKDEETYYLRKQFDACKTSLAILIKLDTLPFRANHKDWLDNLLTQMKQEGALFITGSTLPFRSDVATNQKEIMRTSRVSNNFLIIDPKVWSSLLVLEELPSIFGRYETEGRIEAYCENSGKFGLRRVNTEDWRIFHVQVWDARIVNIREHFRKAEGISSYLSGYQDDLVHPWEEYYMHESPGIWRIAKIWFGAVRRRPLQEISRLKRRVFLKRWVR